MRFLVVDDDPTCRLLLQRVLEKSGHTVDTAEDGVHAQSKLRGKTYDALVLDWMMPRMDGVTLTKWVRAHIKPIPPIVFCSAVNTHEGIRHALSAGADDYLMKPIMPSEIVQRIDMLQQRMAQPAPKTLTPGLPMLVRRAALSSPVGVFIASGTGGPEALIPLVDALQPDDPVMVFVNLQGPAWLIENTAAWIEERTTHRARIAREGMEPRPGRIYLAPQGLHLRLTRTDKLTMTLWDGPRENFVRPSADVLFRSGAQAFGGHAVGVILSGIGRDGALGARALQQAGAPTLVLDPEDATAQGMPRAALDMGLACRKVRAAKLPRALVDAVDSAARAKLPGSPP
jgi:two-component system chemotaxis response regulator CheB